jgi:hypothetical protein
MSPSKLGSPCRFEPPTITRGRTVPCFFVSTVAAAGWLEGAHRELAHNPIVLAAAAATVVLVVVQFRLRRARGGSQRSSLDGPYAAPGRVTLRRWQPES